MSQPDPRFWEIFFEVFEDLPRQGPGNRACAAKALGLCHELRESPAVLDWRLPRPFVESLSSSFTTDFHKATQDPRSRRTGGQDEAQDGPVTARRPGCGTGWLIRRVPHSSSKTRRSSSDLL